MPAGLVSLGKHACGWVNNACEKGEQWQHVLDLFEKMRCESVQRVALTCSAAISACLNGEQWQQALDTHHWTYAAKIVVLSLLMASAGNRYGMTLRAF